MQLIHDYWVEIQKHSSNFLLHNDMFSSVPPALVNKVHTIWTQILLPLYQELKKHIAFLKSDKATNGDGLPFSSVVPLKSILNKGSLEYMIYSRAIKNPSLFVWIFFFL